MTATTVVVVVVGVVVGSIETFSIGVVGSTALVAVDMSSQGSGLARLAAGFAGS